MTQHILPEHTLEDRATLRRLTLVIATFVAFTVALAIGVGIVAG